MLNLDDTLKASLPYNVQRDFYLKAILYSLGVVIFIDIARSQVAEINLLQLVPGFYLVLLFVFLVLLVVLSNFFSRFAAELDNKKEFGAKTLNKIEISILLKICFFLGTVAIYIGLMNIAPLSLDSFNSYGEKTLENLWSFDELLGLEGILLFLLIILLQLPLIGISSINTEKQLSFLPEFWKIITFVSFLISGFLTPTIDGYTQLSFAALSISIYLFIIVLIQKRITLKFVGITTLS